MKNQILRMAQVFALSLAVLAPVTAAHAATTGLTTIKKIQQLESGQMNVWLTAYSPALPAACTYLQVPSTLGATVGTRLTSLLNAAFLAKQNVNITYTQTTAGGSVCAINSVTAE